MLIGPDISSVSIVLVGSLNPLIFRPDWFVRQGLLSTESADEAEIELIHREFCAFKMEWLKLRVDTGRLVAETECPPFIRLADLLTRVFRDVLSHTPLRMLGINRVVHFDVGAFEVREALGKKLAPQEAWGKWAAALKAGEGSRHGGMRSLTMEQRDLDDRPKGFIAAKIEPSVRIQSQSGIFMEINDHYEVADEASDSADAIVRLLEESFERSVGRSEFIIDQIMELSRGIQPRS